MVEERREPASGPTRAARGQAGKPVALGEISTEASRRLSTGVGELDRVLGGGIVPGSLVLLGGAPGIGKSTLTAMALAEPRGRRRAGSVRQWRGVAAAGAARAPSGWRGSSLRSAGAGRDRPRHGASDDRGRAPQRLRDRLRADPSRRRLVRRCRDGRPGAGGCRGADAGCQVARYRDDPRRSRHEGGRSCRPARARAPRRLRDQLRR